ncbi:twitchin-like isoform X2 [Microplitis mediator]|nr:twitchin-like isoform X2 [Microplitis mediator]
MRRLQHPRLIQLYDAIDTGKQFYVVLELIEGGELFERVIDDDFVLTERSCAVFMRQICEGIEFVHSQNILHLDMKPENILCLTKEGNRIKIIDFGLARQYDPRKKLQVLFGTPEFVAPEVVNFDQIGFGTDLWSIGVICYVLLSGLSPFMGDTDVETMANVTIAKYDFDHEAFNNISEDAKDFIRSLLVKDKEKRLTAHQCRRHRWLAPKSSSTRPKNDAPIRKKKKKKEIVKPILPLINNNNKKVKSELDVTKDNLKLFVERWRDHPNSPYLFDDNGTVVGERDRQESMSLRGQSPSPPESICSLTSDSVFDDRLNLNVPNLTFERRASEGQAQDSYTRDPASQIIIAEEIIKLSEHLRSITCNQAVDKMAASSADKMAGKHFGHVDIKARVGGKATDKMAGKQNFYIESKVDDKMADSKISHVEKNSGNIRPKASGNMANKNFDKMADKIGHAGDGTQGTQVIGGKMADNMGLKKFGHVASNMGDGTQTIGGNITDKMAPKKVGHLDIKSGRLLSMTENVNDTNEINEKLTAITRDRKLNGTKFNPSKIYKESKEELMEFKLNRFDREEDIDLTPPWRKSRAKHRFGETCRDVPRITNLENLHKTMNLDEPSSAKNLLLKLLDEWDHEPRARGVNSLPRKSISVDWNDESIGRQSMNSLARYFQTVQNSRDT